MQNYACTLRQMGRPDEAYPLMRDLVDRVVKIPDPESLVTFAEDLAAVLSDLHGHSLAIRLLGAADAMRARNGIPRRPEQDAELADPLARAKAALPDSDYQREYS